MQKRLFRYSFIIDNPLRIPKADPRVLRGDIVVEKHRDLGGGSFVSILNKETDIGPCDKCPEQCGVNMFPEEKT